MKPDIITDNIGLVHSCARRFMGRGVEYEDLFQSGCLGLMKAAVKFDESRGLQFSTYAVPVIMGEIKSLFRYGTAIKVSRGIKELASKIAKETEKYKSEKGASPTLNELADILGVSTEKIAEAIGSTYAPASLTPTEDGEEQRDIPTVSPEERLTDSISLQQAIASLSEEDRKLIALRYFMNKTQKETAGLLGSSQVQISRKEKKILLYIRGALL